MKDLQVEQILSRWVQDKHWSYEQKVPLALIDLTSARHTQSRQQSDAQGRVPEAVVVYRERLERDEEPPAGVVSKNADGTLEPLDCNQRVGSMQDYGLTEADFYILDLTGLKTKDAERLLDKLVVSLNHMLTPFPTDPADKRDQAIYWLGKNPIEQSKTSIEEMMEMFNAPRRWVADVVDEYTAIRRLAGAGFDPTVIAGSILGRLNDIKDDSVLVAAATLVRDAGLEFGEVNSLVTDINKETRGEQARLAVVQAWNDRPDIKTRINRTALKPGGVPRPKRGRGGPGSRGPRRTFGERLLAKLNDLDGMMAGKDTLVAADLTDPGLQARYIEITKRWVAQAQGFFPSEDFCA